MKKLATLYFIFLCITLRAQDPHFINTHQSLVYLNPSFSGSNGFMRDQFAYRNQWPNLSGTYVTYLNSFDAYIKPMKGGIGINYLSDDQARGTLRTSAISLSYAQYFSFLDNKLKIIPSLQFGYFVKTLDRGRLNFGDMIDARSGMVWNTSLIVPSSKKTGFDLSSGLLVNYKNLYIGAGVFHLNQPDEGLLGVSKLPMRYNFHASYNSKINESVLLNYFLLIEVQQNFIMTQLQARALLAKHIITGLGISSNSVINVNAGYRHNFFTILLGYDASVSKLSGNTAGSWELGASINLRNKDNRKMVTNFETW